MPFKKNINYFQTIFLSSWPYLLIRFVLGSIFVYAGFIKLIAPKAFAKAISQYDLLPEIFLAPVAISLPVVEFLAGLGLIFNIRGSLTVIFSLLIVFCMVLGYGILNELNIDCGCFTSQEIKSQNTLKQSFYRDILMIAAVFYMYLHRRVKCNGRLKPFSWLKIIFCNRRNQDVM